MKHLLILFLFTCSVVNGQIEELPVEIPMLAPILVDLDPVDTFTNAMYIQHITLQDLLDYQAECYKDSIVRESIPCPSNIPGCAVNHFRESRVRVETEMTFKGFIEFMKRRYE